MVTGRKTDHLVTGLEADHWLVMTVGVLVIASGATLLFAACRRTHLAEMIFLGAASALGLIIIDVIYVARQTIPPIYLADAAAEAVLLALWIWVMVARGKADSNA